MKSTHASESIAGAVDQIREAAIRRWGWLQRRITDTRDSNDGDRGAVLVEAAFITTLLIMLLMGTVTSAIAFSQNSTLQTSGREASRFGAALPIEGNLTTWLGQVLDVAKSSSNGNLGNAVPGQNICVAYVYPKGSATTDRTTRMVETAGVRTGAVSGAKTWCYDDGRPDDERRVQVLVERQASINAAVFSLDVDLSVPTVARFERGTT